MHTVKVVINDHSSWPSIQFVSAIVLPQSMVHPCYIHLLHVCKLCSDGGTRQLDLQQISRKCNACLPNVCSQKEMIQLGLPVCSPVSFSWHSMDMLYMHGLHWTLLLGQVFHDRCCQCLLVLSSGPMLQWCWLWF